MQILILGGTVFLGRQVAEAALARGHAVTLFHRGRHNPELFPGVEKLHGERDGGLAPLEGRRWDVAIDTCGYVPRVVRASATLLSGSIDRYLFVSSISVYADLGPAGIREDAALGTIPDPTIEEITGETYGPLKALCEGAAEEAMPGRVLIVRPGLIVGPHDPTDRFTYWVERCARTDGREILAPGRPERPIQVIDARDLAGWMVRMAEEGGAGIYHATGPDRTLTLGELLGTACAVAGTHPRLVWVDEAFLAEKQVAPWTELPVWVPEADPATAGLFAADCSRAIAAGLAFRPIEETVRDTLAWCATLPAERETHAGLAPGKERELLDAWRERGAGAGGAS